MLSRFALLVALLVVSTAAAAVPVTMTFTASGFNAGAPQDPVSGSVTWEAAGFPGTITALTGINLTIAGHAYTLGEVGFIDPFGTRKLIGGLVNGVTGTLLGTNDFIMGIFHNGAPAQFVYSTASSGGVAQFLSVDVSVGTSVPAPMTLLLFGLGLAGLAASRYRRPS